MLFVTHQARRSHRTRRRGVGTMLFMVFLVVFLLLLMLVVNYTYLAYAQLRTGEVTDTIARTAVTELLDDHLLDSPGALVPADDVDDAEFVVAHYVNQFNNVSEASQHLRYVPGSTDPADTDVFVTAGRVDNVSAPITSLTFVPFDALDPDAIRLNTLAIEASRPKNGANPLYLFVRNAFTPQTASIGTVSYATLDSRLIGLEPTADVNTPVVPIGILAGAWATPVPANAERGGKSRNDFRGAIQTAAGGNLVLLDFHQGGSVNVNGAFTSKIINGLSQADITVNDGNPSTPSYFLGPVVEGESVVVSNLPAQATIAPGDEAVLGNALDAIADPSVINGERRIFPLVNSVSGGGTTEIVGFVAARVLDAAWTPGQLQVDLEPEFLVHFTAVTSPAYDDGASPPVTVPENVYIHKLRLSR